MRVLFIITAMACIGSNKAHSTGAEASTILKTSETMDDSSILLNNMSDLTNEMKQSYRQIKKIVKTMIKEGKIMESDIEMVTRNPLSQLHFMNRYTEQWKEIEQLLSDLKVSRKLLNELQKSAKKGKKSAAKFLVDLVDVYDLDVRNLTMGIVKGMSSGQNLSMSDCLVFANVAHDKGMYAQCAKWIQQAVEKAVEEKLEFRNETLMVEMAKCTQKQENLLERYRHKKLCRRESTQRDDRVRLKCHYRQHTHPRLLFEPEKVEPLSEYPSIILYHELVPSYLATRLTDLTIEDQKKHGGDTRHFPVTAIDSESDLVAKDVVSRVTLNIDNVNTENVEFLSVFSHPREFRTVFYEDTTQDYISTTHEFKTLLFLTDVKHGGGTVFYRPSINVVPSKGDVLIWQMGQRVAACPVLYGTKLTAKLQPKFYRLEDNVKWYLDEVNDLTWPSLLDYLRA